MSGGAAAPHIAAAPSTAARAAFAELRARMGQAIIGQERVIERLLIALLADGNVLVEGLPGVAKTRAVKALARNLEAPFRRIQFTPDLLPADVVGSDIYEAQTAAFRFEPGPVFGSIVLVDEINRAPAKVQSALLEAMEERQVTVGGTTHPLPRLFMVMATQNPIEQEGTYPLPEAQLDRFLLEIDVGYPDRAAERRILIETTGVEETRAKPAMSTDQLLTAQRLVRRLPVGEAVVEAILDLVRAARPDSGDALVKGKLMWGPGPRASQALTLAVRARALIEGRVAPSVADVKALAEPVLKHRMALGYAARADGETVEGLIAKLAERL